MNQVSGTIVDASNGETLPGANVYLVDEGGKMLGPGDSTDKNGDFTIKDAVVGKPGTFVRISYQGYKSKTIKSENAHQKSIELEPSAVQLDEIVVKPEKKKRDNKLAKKVIIATAITLGVGALVYAITR